MTARLRFATARLARGVIRRVAFLRRVWPEVWFGALVCQGAAGLFHPSGLMDDLSPCSAARLARGVIRSAGLPGRGWPVSPMGTEG